MCPDWRWRDFVLNFAVCSVDFYLRQRIHDLVSITRIPFKDYLMDFFKKIFSRSNFFVYCFVFVHNIGSKHDRKIKLTFFDATHITRITSARDEFL